MPLDAFRAAEWHFDTGLSQRCIGRLLEYSQTTIQYAILRYREAGFYSRKPGKCHKRFTLGRDDANNISNVFRNQFATSSADRNCEPKNRNTKVSREKLESVPISPSPSTDHNRRVKLAFSRIFKMDFGRKEGSSLL